MVMQRYFGTTNFFLGSTLMKAFLAGKFGHFGSIIESSTKLRGLTKSITNEEHEHEHCKAC